MRGAKASYVAVEWNDDSGSPQLVEHVDGHFPPTNLSGGFKATFKTNNGKRIEGHIASSPNVRANYPADLNFSLPISTP